MKINFICNTWGMECVEDIVNRTIEILNTKEWTEEEAKKIEEMFKEIESNFEGLKEGFFGDEL